MNHIKSNLVSSLEHISKISPVISDGFMGLDSFTIKNLEVFQSLSSQGTHGTLIDSIDYTITAGGGRHLRRCLMNPLTDIKKIRSRLNIVEGFTHNKTTLKTIKDLLAIGISYSFICFVFVFTFLIKDWAFFLYLFL